MLCLILIIYKSSLIYSVIPLFVPMMPSPISIFPLIPSHLAARAHRQEDALMREGRVEGSGGGERPKETTAKMLYLGTTSHAATSSIRTRRI